MDEPLPIYLDYQATTPTDATVLAALLPFFSQDFGNPHASEHAFGRTAAEAVARARRQVASLLSARSTEIVFTSGATEANNLLLKSAAAYMAGQGRRRIVSARTEHKAILEVLARLATQGFEIVWAELNCDGLVLTERLRAVVDDQTALVSIMAVNNEIGVIQDLAAIGRISREYGALFHTDAAQACGKIPLDLSQLPVDLLSLSAHKFYGPKGIGAAYIRHGLARQLLPQMDGGGQENGMRAGTLPTPLCVGLGEASALAASAMLEERATLALLRDSFLQALAAAGLSYQLNGSFEQRWPGNLNLSFDGVDAEALVMAVSPYLAISSGSACTADALEPSHVITAMGLEPDRAAGAVRIGFGRSTTCEEVNRAARIIVDSVKTLASIGRVGGSESSGGYGHVAA